MSAVSGERRAIAEQLSTEWPPQCSVQNSGVGERA